jgi:hypothetical protein
LALYLDCNEESISAMLLDCLTYSVAFVLPVDRLIAQADMQEKGERITRMPASRSRGNRAPLTGPA